MLLEDRNDQQNNLDPEVISGDSQAKTSAIKKQLYDRLLKTLDLSLLDSLTPEQAKYQIQEVTLELISQLQLPIPSKLRSTLIKQIEDEVLGLGPLEPLLADQQISDILINGYDKVYVERSGKLESVAANFHDNAHLANIIDRIVAQVGRRIDESSPMVDARLKDGSRVNAVIPPLALDGPALSIRRFSAERLAMQDLVDIKTLDKNMARFLEAVVRGKLNVLISGGTGSGKTTTLNILSGYIPSYERIITIEDSAELQLQQPHVVRLETRPANIEGKGEITQRHLVINCLRMRPDRIVVGEVRGVEAVDMLAAMNTGHDGSLTTIHANTPRDALSRIENMFAMAGWNMPVKNIRAQTASAIHIVIQLQRHEDGCRRVVSIQEINGMEGDVITMSELFHFQRRGVDKDGAVIGDYAATGIVPTFLEAFRFKGIELPMSMFNPSFE